MTRRARQLRRCEALSRRAVGILIGVTMAVCLPVVIVTSRTMEPDLFDLVPKVERIDGYLLLAWPDLERARSALKVGVGSTVRFSARRLVWVWGRLCGLPGNPAGDRPLYFLENASAVPAGRTDIAENFR